VYIHAFMDCSLVNGPGRRAVVWLQGCEIGCAGCWNPATHARTAATSSMPASEVASHIESANKAHSLEGITLSGGEPMHQISDVIWLLTVLKERAPFLSAGLFTGYTETELTRGSYHTYFGSNQEGRQAQWRQLRTLLDFAVMGRFNSRRPSVATPLVSSRNQQLRLFSDRYRFQDFEEQRIEVSIEPDGLTQITGFPTLGSIA
jgi:anaerobic ribonucleoside-triphosphate reductase activating protein